MNLESGYAYDFWKSWNASCLWMSDTRRDSRSKSRRVVKPEQHQAVLGPKMLPPVTPLRPLLYHIFFCLARENFLAHIWSTLRRPLPYAILPPNLVPKVN